MSEPSQANPYAVYMRTWAILLVITVAMLASESFHLPKALLLVYLLVFMLIKASMIGGNFMHLRHENSTLVFIVAAGLLVTSLIFVLFMTPEAASVLQKSLR